MKKVKRFSPFVNRSGRVYILKTRMYNYYIRENMEYSACGVGIHPNGIVNILRGDKYLVVSEPDMNTLAKEFNFSIDDLIAERKAALYTSSENKIRLRYENEKRGR